MSGRARQNILREAGERSAHHQKIDAPEHVDGPLADASDLCEGFHYSVIIEGCQNVIGKDAVGEER